MTLCFFPGLFSKIVLCCRGAIYFHEKEESQITNTCLLRRKKNLKKAGRGGGVAILATESERVVPHMSDTMLSPLARHGGNGHVLKGTDPSNDNRRSPDDHFMRPSLINSLFLSNE